MVLDKSLNMEPKRIRLEASQVPLRPLQIQNNPQTASQHSSRSIQVPIYPAGTMVNGNNSNLQPGRIFVSNVRVRNPTMENTRDHRLHVPPPHNQINLTAGGMGVALGNTMTGAVVPPSGHLPNSMRHNPQQQQQQSQVTLPSYNLHPMPPVFSGNVMRLPANMTGVGGVTQNVTIPSVEVRIGSRKFKTTSGVCFKDDGVLFTLKDYSYAPVLLNARAILKCKANLNVVGYPVIFLFLETSCMKQIRNIFAISEEEFSHHSPVELLRYITIFPTYGPEHKGQSQLIMQSIKKSFDLMLKRFPRPNSVLEEISNEQCIDILYSSFINNSEPSTGAATTVRHNNVDEVVTQSSLAPVMSPLTQSSTAASPMNQPIRNDLLQRSPSQQPSTENFINAAVPLNIPSDQETWRQVQKDLTVGGVYHVMMPNGRKNYCLWNGTQLMPCLVQNTEVQMTCSHARFGMTLLKCIGQVRVKADQTTGIYFTVRNTKKELTEICIQPMDVVKMQIFFHAVNSSVIISVTPECSNRLSESAQLFGERSSLVRRTFDSASGDPSRSYLVLFIQQLHKDQEEALLQMKYGTTTQHIKKGSQMFESIDMQTATSFLCEIITGSSDAGKRYETTNNVSSPQGYEKLVKTFLQKESLVLPSVSSVNSNHMSSVSCVTAVDEDDDDDIIMTQQELGVKCPYTQQVMKNPVMNKKCRHNYEKDAIFEFIALKKGNARCPYAGCANLDPLTAVDLENNDSLREYIEMKQRS